MLSQIHLTEAAWGECHNTVYLFCMLDPITIANVAFITAGSDCRKAKIKKEKLAVVSNHLTAQLD